MEEDLYQEVIIDKNTENKIFGKTFFWMFLGLLGTAIIAAYTYYSGLYINIISDGYWRTILVLELVIVLVFNLLFRKLSPTAVGILYFVYSMVNGIAHSITFALFDLSSIVYLFVVSSLVFAVLGFIGYKTNKDLSSWSTYITVFLIAGIILSLIDLFIIRSTGFDLAVDWFILVLFFGITVYDINKMKLLQSNTSLDTSKVHIYCAMQLYLDFIIIFFRILSIFGRKSNN